MNQTNIAWTNYTWNPITGCTAVSDGCKNCYAKIVHERFNDTPFSEIIFHEDRLVGSYNKKKGKMIFVGSMTDLFQDEVTYEMFSKIMVTITGNPQHIFQMLTKRPLRMKKFFDRYNEVFEVPENLWLGVTAENQKEADARIPILLDTPASKRFISVEPMVGEIDLHNVEELKRQYFSALAQYDPRRDSNSLLDWVIVGGESGAKPKVREMKPEWIQKIYDDCKANSVPFFFKQWGAHKPKDIGTYEFEKVQQFPND